MTTKQKFIFEFEQHLVMMLSESLNLNTPHSIMKKTLEIRREMQSEYSARFFKQSMKTPKLMRIKSQCVLFPRKPEFVLPIFMPARQILTLKEKIKN